MLSFLLLIELLYNRKDAKVLSVHISNNTIFDIYLSSLLNQKIFKNIVLIKQVYYSQLQENIVIFCSKRH